MKYYLTITFAFIFFSLNEQNDHPITAEKEYQFDFWVDEWDVYLRVPV